MAVLNIAIVGEDGFARSIAKPSDHRDVDTYVHKTGTGEDARILSLIRPTRYPERLRRCSLRWAPHALVSCRSAASTARSVNPWSHSPCRHRARLLIFEPEEGGWIDEERAMAMVRQAGLDAWKAVPSDANVIEPHCRTSRPNRVEPFGRPRASARRPCRPTLQRQGHRTRGHRLRSMRSNRCA